MKRYATMSGAFCLCIALLAACGGGNDTPPTQAATQATTVPAQAAAPTAAAVAATAPAAPAGDPKQAVIAAMRAQMDSGPYRTYTTIVSDDNTTEITGEMIPPDKLHTVMKGKDFASESIYIGENGWNNVGGQWTKSLVSGSQVMAQMGAGAAQDLEKIISDVQAAGTDTVDGQSALVYTYSSTIDLGEGNQVSSAIKLWVSAATGLPVKLESQSEAMGIKSTFTQLVEQDPTITIEPPVQ